MVGFSQGNNHRLARARSVRQSKTVASLGATPSGINRFILKHDASTQSRYCKLVRLLQKPPSTIEPFETAPYRRCALQVVVPQLYGYRNIIFSPYRNHHHSSTQVGWESGDAALPDSGEGSSMFVGRRSVHRGGLESPDGAFKFAGIRFVFLHLLDWCEMHALCQAGLGSLSLP
jgi:hypothetical protein